MPCSLPGKHCILSIPLRGLQCVTFGPYHNNQYRLKGNKKTKHISNFTHILNKEFT